MMRFLTITNIIAGSARKIDNMKLNERDKVVVVKGLYKGCEGIVTSVQFIHITMDLKQLLLRLFR